MRIFLIRHGETDNNVKRILQGQSYGRLTENGMEQARKVADRLASEHIDAVFSSPFERADMTAREIARRHSLDVTYDDRLKERHHGNLEGIHVDDYYMAMEKSGVPRHEYRPEGGESYGDVAKRVESFYRMLLEKYQGKNVAVVAHGSLNRVFLSVAGHCGLDKAPEIRQDNTCMNVIEIMDGIPRVSLVNCTKHLE